MKCTYYEDQNKVMRTSRHNARPVLDEWRQWNVLLFLCDQQTVELDSGLFKDLWDEAYEKNPKGGGQHREGMEDHTLPSFHS